MRDPLLAAEEVDGRLAAADGDLSGWRRDDDRLVRTVRCDTFAGAIELVDAVAALAEAADHHPDIDIRYKVVTLVLTTHDSGGITWRDVDLAGRIEETLSSD